MKVNKNISVSVGEMYSFWKLWCQNMLTAEKRNPNNLFLVCFFVANLSFTFCLLEFSYGDDRCSQNTTYSTHNNIITQKNYENIFNWLVLHLYSSWPSCSSLNFTPVKIRSSHFFQMNLQWIFGNNVFLVSLSRLI